MALAVCGVASAAIVTWQGGDGVWSNANWDIDGTPNSAYPNIEAPVDYAVNNFNTVNVSSGNVSVGTYGIYGRKGTLNILGTASITGTGAGATLQLTDKDCNYYFNTAGTISMNNIVLGAGTSSSFTVDAGNFVLGGANAIATGGSSLNANNRFRLEGAGGDFVLTQTDNSTAGKELFQKVKGGFFQIDGVNINSTVVQSNGWDAAEVAALNAELAGQVVAGRYLQVTDLGAGGQQVALIPEPATIGLVAAFGGAMLFFRRKFTA